MEWVWIHKLWIDFISAQPLVKGNTRARKTDNQERIKQQLEGFSLRGIENKRESFRYFTGMRIIDKAISIIEFTPLSKKRRLEIERAYRAADDGVQVISPAQLPSISDQSPARRDRNRFRRFLSISFDQHDRQAV